MASNNSIALDINTEIDLCRKIVICNPEFPIKYYFCSSIFGSWYDLLAQSVEQRPFKPWVLGSSPKQITKTVNPLIPPNKGIFYLML